MRRCFRCKESLPDEEFRGPWNECKDCNRADTLARMRARRARTNNAYDKARNAATAELRERHREEFDRLLEKHKTREDV